MAKINATPGKIYTFGGAVAKRITPLMQLQRSVASCFLWEDEFYEDGESIAARIAELAGQVEPMALARLAVKVREEDKLRHAPLMLLSVLSRTGSGNTFVADAIERVIKRPDEMGELLAIHAKLNGTTADKVKKTISAQMKKGIARAYNKFDAYQLGKYNRDAEITLKDVMFLTHPKPINEAQEKMWATLIDGTLPTPDTWEVALSGGADKKEAFTRLITEGKLGYFALIRNLRNMEQVGVDDRIVRDALLARKGAENILPFRYVAAARHAPRYAVELDKALQACVKDMPQFDNETLVLVDVSGSMNAKLSAKSDLTRMDAAAALAAIIPGRARVFSFSREFKEVAGYKGLPGIDAIIRSQPHGGTDLAGAVRLANKIKHDRLIVISDEQATTRGIPDPVVKDAYMINVASYKNGVGYGPWTHIDGFSENVLRYIKTSETLNIKDWL